MAVSAIVTIPPYAPFVREVARHPMVSGLRLNTVMPVKEPLDELLKRLKLEAGSKELWVDLKCRQLRVTNYAVAPFTEITVSHRLSVQTPVTAYFSDGKESATIVAVDGNRLLMLNGPRRVVGPGESVNIPDKSLKIDGYLTDTDKLYIEAALKADIHNFMLSYVEHDSDVASLNSLAPGSVVVAKIESLLGLDYIAASTKLPRLMAARGDLYTELKKPHHIIQALDAIIKKDHDAIVASRIFPSLSESLEPSCQDIGDVDCLLRIGYRTLMLGDDICMNRDSVISALNLLEAIAARCS